VVVVVEAERVVHAPAGRVGRVHAERDDVAAAGQQPPGQRGGDRPAEPLTAGLRRDRDRGQVADTGRAARVGGAGEQTVLARVGEGIVTTIGSAATHLEVMEKPDAISKTVLAKGLDAGTAFEILSIDIADVVVGQNIGARLQADQAEADKKVAQAKAEERRSMAVAREQEMKAYTQEMQAKVVESQAQVPQALAEALRSGNLGVMDYYNLRNLQADTAMRSGISRATGGADEDGGAGSTTGPVV